MNRKLLLLSVVFLLGACGREEASKDADTSKIVEKENVTSEKSEETKRLPKLIGTWVEESKDSDASVKFLELGEDYASIFITETDNVFWGPIVKKEQTDDSYTVWVYEGKDDAFESPEAIIPLTLGYEEVYGEIQIESDDDWLVPTEATDFDLSSVKLYSEDIADYPIERAEELKNDIDSYISYEEAEKRFEEKMKEDGLSFQRKEEQPGSIYFSDGGRPFYSISYKVGNSMREFDFIAYADTGETEVRKSSDKLYTFVNPTFESDSEEVESKESASSGSGLSGYSANEIEYARVWLSMGYDSNVEEINVSFVKKGELVDEYTGGDAVFPEPLVAIGGKDGYQGTIYYSSNSNGTVNVYTVPSHWPSFEDIESMGMTPEEFAQSIVDDTTLVSVDPSNDEDIIRLIQKMTIHKE